MWDVISGIGNAVGSIFGAFNNSPWAPVASAYMSHKGIKMQNQANRVEAQTNRAFQSKMFNKANVFSRNMANSVHQREVADLQKAGLNPMLALNGGAPSPSSASPPAGNMPHMEDEIGPAVSSGFQASRVQAELKNIAALTEKTQADTAVSRATESLVRSQEPAVRAKTALDVASAGEVAERIRVHKATVDKVYQETKNLKSEKARIEAGTAMLYEQARNLGWDTQRLMKAVEELSVRIEGDRLDLSKKRVYSDFYEGTFGKVAPYASEIFGAGGSGVLNSAREAMKEHRLSKPRPFSRKTTRSGNSTTTEGTN